MRTLIFIFICFFVSCHNITQNKNEIQSIEIKEDSYSIKEKSDTLYFKNAFYDLFIYSDLNFSASGFKVFNYKSIKSDVLYKQYYTRSQYQHLFFIPHIKKDSIQKLFGRSMLDTKVIDSISKRAYLNFSELQMYATLNTEMQRYSIDKKEYLIYKTDYLNCYDSFCSAKHGHSQYVQGKLYYSLDFGLLIKSSELSDLEILRQVDSTVIPKKLLREVLKKNNFDNRVISRYEKF